LWCDGQVDDAAMEDEEDVEEPPWMPTPSSFMSTDVCLSLQRQMYVTFTGETMSHIDLTSI